MEQKVFHGTSPMPRQAVEIAWRLYYRGGVWGRATITIRYYRNNVRESDWTQSIAVGSKKFTEKVLSELGHRAKGRSVIGNGDVFQVRENQTGYCHNNDFDNTFAWDQDSSGNLK